MWVNTGLLFALAVVTQQLAIENILMGLITNVYTFLPSTVLGDLTEPTQTGYARQVTNTWSAPIIVGGNEGETNAVNVTFTNTDVTDITAQGYFYITQSSLTLLGGANFVTPQTVLAGGGVLLVQPQGLDTSI